MRRQYDFQAATLQAVLPNGPLALIDEGQGIPLLLIHGSLCDFRFWQAQITLLSKHFRVIAPSLRYYWPLNDQDKDPSFFTATSHAQDLIDLIEILGLTKIHVLGHSRGGAVATEFARLAPEHTASLILADPGLRDHESLNDSIHFKRHALELIDQGHIDEGLAIFVDSVTGQGAYQRMVPWFKQMVRDNVDTLHLQQKEPPILLDPQKLALFEQFPITLIGGKHSPNPFPQIIQKLATIWPHAKVNQLNATHGMNLALPHAFNELVKEHIQALS